MSGSTLIMLAALAAKNEKERKEAERRLKELAKQTTDEKTLYLATKAIGWENDADIVSAYEAVLDGQYLFNSIKNHDVISIDLEDFFAFLTQFKEHETIVRIIEENKLLLKALKKRNLFSFINATNLYNSVIGRGKNRYSLEQDIYQNRRQIFRFFCWEQRRPACPQETFPFSDGIINWHQETFLKILQEKTHPILKKILSTDAVVPAIIMASGDKKFEKMYRKYLEKKEFVFDTNKKIIAEVFQTAREWSKNPEYQNLFISACPAVKIKRKFGIFSTFSFDNSQTYECPIIKKALERQNSH